MTVYLEVDGACFCHFSLSIFLAYNPRILMKISVAMNPFVLLFGLCGLAFRPKVLSKSHFQVS